jgi:hypothetical protein
MPTEVTKEEILQDLDTARLNSNDTIEWETELKPIIIKVLNFVEGNSGNGGAGGIDVSDNL